MKIKLDKKNKGIYIKALEHTVVLKSGYLQVIDDHGLETFYLGFEVIKALGGIIFAWGLTIALMVL